MMAEHPNMPGGLLGIAAAYVRKKWGASTRPILTPSGNITLGVATRILKNNPRRIQATIQNNSPDYAYLGFDSAVDVNHGIVLAPIGGSVTFLVDEDGEEVSYEMWIILNANGTVTTIEVQET